MTEWLILLFLVPAIVVPVVLLVGFAGCNFERGGGATPVPVIESAVAKSDTIITLTWTGSTAAVTFEFERTRLPERTTMSFQAALSPFDDTGLQPGTSYEYRVRNVFADGPADEWSAVVIGTTFGTTFSEPLPLEQGAWEGFCLVQRIEAAELSRSGTQVKLHLRASSTSNASIDRVSISQPDPTAGRDPFDSDADLTAVMLPTIPFVVPAAQTQSLLVNYNLDEAKALLIAVDFSAAPPSAIAFQDPAPARQVAAYFRAGSEAGLRDRTAPYSETQNRIYLFERIEVA